MHREMGQPSLVESLLPEKPGQNQRLERIHQAVDWVRIGKLAAQVYDAPEGRPSYPPLLMVKVLLLEQWYNLSDPQMEEALGAASPSDASWGWACRKTPRTIRPSAGSARRWRSGGWPRNCLWNWAGNLRSVG